MSMATRGEYKGHPTITLSDKPGDKFGFSFGLTKARLILKHIDEIKAFVTEDDIAVLQAKIEAEAKAEAAAEAAEKAKAA